MTESITTESLRAAESGGKPDILEFERLRAARLETDPFDYLVASGVIGANWTDRLIGDYPKLKRPGSFPLSAVRCGSDFSRLIQALDGKEFREIVEDKFSIQLGGRPTMFTVRGRCRLKDGTIHTDTESKIITVLLYMNRSWESDGGRLRLLRSANNLDDVVIEIPPLFGTMLIFRRCNYSFHGHLPFEGTRRAIQMNWVTEQKFVDRENRRHRWSALFKTFQLT
jgi:SM-20-related protein